MPGGADEFGIELVQRTLAGGDGARGLGQPGAAKALRLGLLAFDAAQGFVEHQCVERVRRQIQLAQHAGAGRFGSIHGAQQRQQVGQLIQGFAQVAQQLGQIGRRHSGRDLECRAAQVGKPLQCLQRGGGGADFPLRLAGAGDVREQGAGTAACLHALAEVGSRRDEGMDVGHPMALRGIGFEPGQCGGGGMPGSQPFEHAAIAGV